jgi:glucose/arabinose dehydrogenase
VARPCGLAQGADGSLYISDSVKGTIWKVTYNKQ